MAFTICDAIYRVMNGVNIIPGWRREAIQVNHKNENIEFPLLRNDYKFNYACQQLKCSLARTAKVGKKGTV